MPADIVSDTLSTTYQQETIVLMDDYGSMISLNILVSQAQQRAAIISDAQSSVQSRQASMEQYASQAGMPLPTPMALAQKQAFFDAQAANPVPVSTMTVTAPSTPAPATAGS